MTNKLSHSTSPYLLQHADNPVHWREWDEAALEESRRTGKPILLSVGYSACHWCHVMAHESFEDEGIAALMNDLFINIKVDREERPDIDQIYQTAHAMLTQKSGGWPLTMFLTPDTVPFFGGTYFPRTARYGLPGFGDLLKRVAAYHRERGDDIREQNGRLLAALCAQQIEAPSAEDGLPGPDVFNDAWTSMRESFDPQWGGFGNAPKFPHPEMIEFCLREFSRTGNEEAAHVACHTLERMCKGGLHDQLGGGFARYSVDERWAIPHFEKMLYDNGPLLWLLADAARVTRSAAQRALFARCAAGIADWAVREMQSPAGGYYSTLDADSEGHEGTFYIWQRDAVRELLTDQEWAVAAAHFGLDRAPNFEDRAWHLVAATDLPENQQAVLESARAKLFADREKRIRPGRDEKILTSWNALFIEGMARAGVAFDQAEWVDSACRALRFLRDHMWDTTTRRLLATHKDGVSRLNAYLDDYAFLLKAIIALLQARWDRAAYDFAADIADVLVESFEDQTAGGFYFTSHDHETLIQRTKPHFDNATPSGNGVAAFALQRWAHVAQVPRFESAARRTLSCFAKPLRERPAAHGSFLVALAEALEPPRHVILSGPEEDLRAWHRALNGYQPDLMLFTPGPDAPEALKRPVDSKVIAWLCHGVACEPPIDDIAQLQASL
jgi:uncharacterized protein YyaL (SSP411 family)